MKKIKKVNMIILSIALVVCVLIMPFNLLISKERCLIVTDKNNTPLTKAVVRQIWYQYSLNIRGEVDLIVNQDGEVVLKKRVVKTTLISLVTGAIKEFNKVGIDASFGSNDSIGVLAEGYENKWIHNGEGLKNIYKIKIIMKRERGQGNGVKH